MAQRAPEPFPLPSPPNDGITSLLFLPPSSSSSSSSSLLASTSWDGSLRVHDVPHAPSSSSSSRAVLSIAMGSGPLLSMTATATTTTTGSMMIYAGGSDGTVKRLDVGTSAIDVVGRHSRGSSSSSSSSSSSPPAASCLSSLGDGDDDAGSSPSLIASAGWDKRLHVWDARVGGGGGGGGRPVASADLPGKAFGMDASRDGRMIVVATSGRRNCFFDVRRLPSTSTSPQEEEEGGGGDGDDSAAVVEVELLADRESSLKYQTRCVRFFGSQECGVVGIAVGSIEGRVAIEYMDDLGVKSNGGE